jgi:hypothetical protein
MLIIILSKKHIIAPSKDTCEREQCDKEINEIVINKNKSVYDRMITACGEGIIKGGITGGITGGILGAVTGGVLFGIANPIIIIVSEIKNKKK